MDSVDELAVFLSKAISCLCPPDISYNGGGLYMLCVVMFKKHKIGLS
jgi:hypothetical protein